MNRKLTDDKVIQARRMYRDGLPPLQIADFFGVSRDAAERAIFGLFYKHVPFPVLAAEKRKRNPSPFLEQAREKARIVNSGHKRIVGGKHHNAVTNEITVSYIKAHLLIGVSRCLLMRYFRVSKKIVDDIARGINWKHVKPHPKPPEVDWIAVQMRGLTYEEKIDALKPIRLRGARLKSKLGEKIDSLKAKAE